MVLSNTCISISIYVGGKLRAHVVIYLFHAQQCPLHATWTLYVLNTSISEKSTTRRVH